MKKLYLLCTLLLSMNIMSQDAIDESRNNENMVAMKNLDEYAKESTRNLCEDLKAKKCYLILMIPVILGGIDDPLSDGRPLLAGDKIARIVEQDIPAFYTALQESPRYLVDVKPGDQYELIFLMKEHPTNDDYRIRVRICDGRIVIRIKSKDGNGLFVQAGVGFSEWISQRSVTFKK